VNLDTLHQIERPYREIVDDLLTAMVGGVVNEPVLYDEKLDAYPLAEPARAVRGITGTVDGESHSFVSEVDFRFNAESNSLLWEEGGARPDDETTFFVDYFRPDSRSPLTDLNVGSVTRTLAEAVGREIATVYRQIHRAYLSAFLDTAEGRSLDLVVAILGLTRKTGEFASSLATFFRDPAVKGDLTLPQGLGITTEKGDVVFETTEPRTLQRGQGRVDVPIRAAEDFAGEAGIVAAGAITRITRPVAGIARVTNLDATALAAGDETDEELRLRARAALRALGKATLAALDRAIREGRGEPLEFWDPNGPPAKRSTPGTVTVFLDAEPERLPSLRTAVHDTRAAGVLATLVARYVYFTPRLVATVTPGITGPGRDKVKEEILMALQSHVNALGTGEPALATGLLEALKEKVPDISDPVFRDVLTARTDLERVDGESLAETLAGTVLETGTDDEEALRESLAAVLTTTSLTGLSGRRIPDRSLLESTAEGREGQPATDEEIEAGEFQIAARVDGEDWWVALDMGPADIRLETGEEGS